MLARKSVSASEAEPENGKGQADTAWPFFRAPLPCDGTGEPDKLFSDQQPRQGRKGLTVTQQLWRVHLKPGAKPGIDVPKLCLARGIFGVGWGLPDVPASKDDYWTKAKAAYYGTYKRKWSGIVKPVLYDVKIGDLVWVRDQATSYYLGKVTGDWEYRGEQEYTDADVVNIRCCDWQRAGEMDNVPGSVISSFIARRTVQRVKDSSALVYSRYLYATLRGEPLVPDPQTATSDILELLSDSDLEDVVAVYLQVVKKAVMFPSTCKTDTKAIECVFTSTLDGQRIGLQVKRGSSPISQDVFSDFNGTVYLFQARGNYQGKASTRCVCLAPDEIRKFIFEQQRLMPGKVQKWIEFVSAKAT